MKINCILACDLNNIIGFGLNLPWKIKEEMQHFKTLTTGNTLVMGSVTFLEIVRTWPINVSFLKDRQIIELQELVKKYKKQLASKGSATNFMHLVCDPSIEAAYFAFCDQGENLRGKLCL